VDAFKENLEDLERQVVDIASEAQQLERCTTDAVSFEVGGAVPLQPSGEAAVSIKPWT
jgi:hypothetical protein